MSKHKTKDSFWLSYSDLMTSLFFVMLVLFVISICMLNHRLGEVTTEKETLTRITQIDKQFSELSKSSELLYLEDKKMFVAKDLIGIEIFEPNKSIIKPQYIPTVNSIGRSLQTLIKQLYDNNPDLSFQLVIEGNAAIPWDALQSKSFNENSVSMYKLSYERALALYLHWYDMGINLKHYNTEVIIAGSGFSGENRDLEVEENNKRFIIQIIPKVSRIKEYGSTDK